MSNATKETKNWLTPKPIREGLLAFFVVFAASVFSIASIYFDAKRSQVEAVRSELDILARQAATSIDPITHQQLNSVEQMGTDLYERALKPLADFHRSVPEIYYIYSMIKPNEELIFVLDTSSRPDWLQFDREMTPSALMDTYEAPGPTALRAYEAATPMTVEEPYTDEFGTFMSGYAPVFNKQGERIALVGIDLELSDFRSRMAPIQQKAWNATVTAFLIASLTGFGLTRVRQGSAQKAAQLATTLDELLAAKTAAEEATTAKGQFLATISHEIRTPLNGLVGVLHLLGKDLPEDKRQLLQTAHNCSEDLQALINDVLDFSKIEANKLSIETSPVDARSICSDILALQSPNAAEKGLKLHFTAEEDKKFHCLADPIRLRQILNNLTNNAIKFTPKGSIAIRLTKTNNEDDPNFIRFEIIDTGMGVSPKTQSQLFQPFTQENASTTREVGGTGLGLSISRKLVELMGGTIGVKSVKGEGSTFWFELPSTKKLADDPILKASINADADTAANHDYSKLRLLIVDDNITNRLITQALVKQRHEILADTAVDGQEALELVSKNGYDIILMDCMMPKMDGYEATKAIRSGEAGEVAKDATIIALTANTSLEDREACRLAGMNDYLPKPIAPKALSEALNKWSPRVGL